MGWVIRFQSLHQELGGKEFQMVSNRELLALLMEVGDGRGRVASSDEAEGAALDFLETIDGGLVIIWEDDRRGVV